MAIRRRLLLMAAAVRRVLHTITSATGIVSFSTNLAEPVESLACEVLPVQDLNGYASPWPGGGGKNLFDASTVTVDKAISATGEIIDFADSCYTALIPVTAGQTYTYSGICAASSSNNKRVHGYANGVWQSQITVQNIAASASFAITFTIPSGVDGIRISAWTADTERQVEKGSSKTSYAPYENICPISGWDKLNIHRFSLPPGYTPAEYVTIQQKITIDRFGTGFVNFGTNGLHLSCEWKSTIYKQYGAIYTSTYVNESTDITRLIYRTASNAYLVNNNNKPSSSYALYNLEQDTWHHIDSRYAKVTVDGTEYTSSGVQGTATTGTTFSLGWDGCNISFRQMDIHGHPYYNDTTPYLSLVPCTNPNNVAGFYDIVTGNFWTTPDSTKAQAHGTAYKIDHYGEELVNVDWTSAAGTVYGGSLNVTTGVLTVTHSYWTEDETKSWNYSSGWSKTNTACFYINGQYDVKYENDNFLSYTHCDRFKCFTRNQLYSADTEGISTSGSQSNPAFTLRINKTRASTVPELKTWLASNPINIIFVRRYPQTIQLTPAEVATLKGSNTIWHDGNGAITVGYYDNQ